ncbi:MAG: hypothetical protein JSS49_06255 [Planctomycetes bacterium]|nr:hypothetical protein [Planctomycetota bacterium]
MAQGRKLPWHRKLMFNAVMLVSTWILIEGMSLLATYLFIGFPSRLFTQRQTVAAQDPYRPGGKLVAPTVIHPYIGAVQQPSDNLGVLPDKYQITQYGFFDDAPPIHNRAPDKVIVGILGGSVARQFSVEATDQLAQELSRSPEYAGKKFEFVRLAGNGYKQPQQLMIMNYVFTLGAEFDILINLDGFNEAALPAMDNVPFGVFAAYPRDWGKMIAATASQEFQRMGGHVSYLRQQERDEARFFDRTPVRYSPALLLLWAYRHQASEQVISSKLQVMTRYAQGEQSYCGTGPAEHFDSTDAMYDHCIAIWKRTSILLQNLCQAQGIRYYHFLQPNQYVPGSKPMGPEETQLAIKEESQICEAVRFCFPRMQMLAPELEAAGVTFTDLTRVFADHPEPIYRDDCCHVEAPGNFILAKAIAHRILEQSSK